MIIGGGKVVSASFAKAWGVNPSAAQACLIGDITVGVGSYITFSYSTGTADIIFYGVVTEASDTVSFGTGSRMDVTVCDNRIRLRWQCVFGAWNIKDDMARKRLGRPAPKDIGASSSSNGSTTVTVGADVGSTSSAPESANDVTDPGDVPELRRRFKHLLPQNWESGIWTWTDAPMNAQEILDSAFNHAWGDFGFARSYHSSMSSATPMGIDHAAGIKLVSLLSEMNEKMGTDCVISGDRDLVFGRKGEGTQPYPDMWSEQYRTGLSLTGADTAIRVVGGRTRIQCANVQLDPDWARGWEAFMDERDWMDEVAKKWSMPHVTKSDWGLVAAKCRTVTVYEYAKKVNDPSFLDYRAFGRVSRASIPAWVYREEIVFKSYRIPADKTLYGVPLSSLDFADSLLVATELQGSGSSTKQVYSTADTPEYYPQSHADLFVKGEPLDLINAHDIKVYYQNAAESLKDEYAAVKGFELDHDGKSVRFHQHIFINGSVEEGKGLFYYPNKGQKGCADVSALVADNSTYLDIVLPNPNYELSPAVTLASFCFLFGNYYKDFGYGPSRGVLNDPGIELHLIDVSGGATSPSAGCSSFSSSALRLPDAGSRTFKEITYEDGEAVADKAAAAASAMIGLSPALAAGGFTRKGAAGIPVDPTVDRVTIEIAFGGGITERVEYAKARTTHGFVAERTMQRIQSSAELFSGQHAMKDEAKQYLMLAASLAKAAKPAKNGNNPLGDTYDSTVEVIDKNGAAPEGGWKAGHLVWLDEEGIPTQSTTSVFGGVVTKDGKTVTTEGVTSPDTTAIHIQLARDGTAPVRISGSVQGGASVYADSGSETAKGDGGVLIGKLAHAEAVPRPDGGGDVFGLVQLGVDKEGGGQQAAGAFLRTYTKDNGDLMLQGGTVTGGSKVITIQDYVLLSHTDDPPEDPTDNAYHEILTIAVDANKDDDVLVPGCLLTSASIAMGHMVDDVIPTDTSVSGTLHLSLGQWNAGIFHPAGICGNITIQAWLGNLTTLRT